MSLQSGALRLISGLLISLGAQTAVAGAAPTTDFQPDFRRIARVSCPTDSALPRPLLSAAACNDTSRVRVRLAEGADLTATETRPQLLGRTALHHAAQLGNVTTVALLLDAGADPNAVDALGNTPLHVLLTAQSGASAHEIAEHLIAAGADARLRNGRERTPADEFAARGRNTVDPLRLNVETLRQMLAQAEASGPVAVARPMAAAAHPDSAENQAAIAASGMPLLWKAETPVAADATDTPNAAEPAPVKTVEAPAATPVANAAPATAPEVKTPAKPAESKPAESKPVETKAVAPAPQVAAAAPAEDPSRAVRAAVQAWADAWSARNVDAYLGHYAKSFKPSSGMTVERWRAQRRERVGKPEAISVTLSDVSVQLDGERAVVKFEQDYQSVDYKVVDRKTLVFVREGKAWKIAEEYTGG